jgi:uncharacterized membrane protein YhiD involved in acid resistance
MNTFEEYISENSGAISIESFALNIIFTILLAAILSSFYTKFGNTLSNRKIFSQNFILLAVTTMLVITIVKSSLALSLGLVGALSIVRFRSAIKEPEELSYLFLTIALGLGFGANQSLITIIAFAIILASIYLFKRFKNEITNQESLLLNITTKSISSEAIIEILKRNCEGIDLKRLDEESGGLLEASFVIIINDYSGIEILKSDLRAIDKEIHISFINNQNLIY